MPFFARLFRRASVPAFTAAALLLTACATAPTTPVTPILPAKAGITGTVHGGQQAVSGATVQLWAVGTAGDGSASTPLLNPAVVTDANGNFNITGLYVCPSASRLVYLTATGGNPGLTVGTNNSFLAMMAALGTCGSLSSSTYVTMNEVTTIGSVFALAPYMGSYSAIGYNASSPNSDLSAITSAFSEVNEFVNIATGVAGGTTIPSGYGVNVAQINTLADLLATCINSTGGTSPGQPCYNLDSFGYQTIQIAQEIAANPTNNLTTFFNEVPPSSPFQPQLSAAPSTWAISVQPVVATPTISPNGGTYTSSQTVTLADTTPNAAIHYTLDGTTPTSTSATYSTALTVSTTETINAIATLSGDLDSSIASASYILSAPASGTVTTIAGNGTPGFSGDGGQATSAELNDPYFLTLDASGNIYFADFNNRRIRMVTPAGTISTVAGNGTQASDGTLAAYSELIGTSATGLAVSVPEGVAIDSSGNLYIASDNLIRKVTPSYGYFTVSAYAGSSYGSAGYTGDSGQATSATLRYPQGIAFDNKGNLYIADTGNNVVRKVTAAGIISTYAGTGYSVYVGGPGGYSGDGGQATNAELNQPNSVVLDSSGNLYISEIGNCRVRQVTPAGIISTFAGNGTCGTSGDGGPATSAELQTYKQLAVDSSNNIYVGLRKIAPGGTISTPVAANSPTLGDFGIVLDSSSNIYTSDAVNNVIHKVAH
jgi:sugar lactone lactonase YvrE